MIVPVSGIAGGTGEEVDANASPAQGVVLAAGEPPAEIAPTQISPVEIAAAQPVPSTVDRPMMSIDFTSVLGFAGAQNPQVGFAQAQVRQAYAQAKAARVLWLPDLRMGMNYNKHEGRIQDVEGQAIETSRGAAYAGLGASAVGAASPAIPGVYMHFHLADAVHQPRVAGCALHARRAQSTTVAQNEQLDAAILYLQLLEASQRAAIAKETLRHGDDAANMIQSFANAGVATELELQRSRIVMTGFQLEANRAQESIQVASARLAEQLGIDPLTQFLPDEGELLPLDLVALDAPLNELVATGLSSRSELAANRALVCEAVHRLRREKQAPWLPSVILGVSQGGFGAGLGRDIENGGDRFDLDGIVYWEVRRLGFGEQAARQGASAQVEQARWREIVEMNQVAREVVEHHAQAVQRRQNLVLAESSLASAQSIFDLSLQRLRNAIGSSDEVYRSLQTLELARREYLRCVVEYNEAQFRLQRALGWNPAEI